MDAQTQEIEKLKQLLLEKELTIQRLIDGKKKNRYDKRDRVYVYEDTTNQNSNVYKIGYSSSMNTRAGTYRTTRYENNLQYELPCKNGRLTESVVHHILQRFVDVNKREWFHIQNFQIIKNIIIIVQKILDDIIDIEASEDDILQITQDILQCKPLQHCISQIDNDDNDDNVDNEKDSDYSYNDHDRIIDTLNDKAQQYIMQFFKECIEDEPNTVTKATDITSLFRVWSKGQATKEERAALHQHLRSNYTRTGRVWNAETKTDQNAYKGLKLKDYKYYNPDLSDESHVVYDKFIKERCAITPCSRVPMYLMTKEFLAWKVKNNLNCDNEKREHLKLHRFLCLHFVYISGSFIFDGKHESSGMYGITLNEYNNTRDCCHSSKSQLKRKTVYKIDPSTNKVVGSFDSATECSRALHNDMSYRILRKIVHKDGFLYTYNHPDDQ